MNPPSFFSGTSGLVLPIKQSDYPPEYKGASRLTYYASQFTSLEINSSFYQIPKAATVEKWRDSVPETFRFTFKVPKTVTHAKGLAFPVEEIELFAETVQAIGDKRGCLLVQLPPKVSRDSEAELEGLLECLTADAPGWKIAVEFRHVSWYNREVYRMLQRHGAGMVEQDLPASPTPQVDIAPFVYLRFHGPGGRYRGSYEDAFLEEHASRIKKLLGEGKEVYAYFNNTAGDAVGNLQTLNNLL
jgi:uncharacterized protein YecE (DUF72 family)